MEERNYNNNNTNNNGGTVAGSSTYQPREEALTSKSLGIADKRKRDLTGYVLSPQEIQESVMIMLIKLGIRRDEIHSVKISKDKDGLYIVARVEEDAVSERGNSGASVSSWVGVGGRTSKLRINPAIFNGLRNKAFVGNLHYQKEKIKGDNYIVLNFDPEVLLSFMYNIPYDDEFLKIVPFEWNSNKKQAKKLGYVPCGAIITYTHFENNKGFHYSQVVEMHSED